MTIISTERLEEMRLLPCPFCGVSLVLTEQEQWVHPWDDVCPADDIHIHYRDEPRINAWNRRSLDKGEVAIKPLEWEESVVGRWIGTPTPKLGDLAFWVFHDQSGTYKRAAEGGWQFYPTLEEAKAAAQADFETRIRSALASQPAPKGMEIEEEGNS